MFANQNNFNSRITASNPFSGSQARGTRVKAPYMGGDQTRSAMSRALMDSANTEIGSGYEQARRQYQQAGEEARSQDVQRRYQANMQDYGFGKELAVGQRRNMSQRQQGLADLDSQLFRAQQDYKVARMSNLANLFLQGGLLTYPTASEILGGYRPQNPILDEAGRVLPSPLMPNAGDSGILGGLFR